MKRVEGADLEALSAFLPVENKLPVFYERLSFYERATLLSFGKLHLIAAGPGPIGTGGDYYHLNGESRVILRANKDLGLLLTEETAPAYLKFFCRFISSEDVQFEVVESIDGYAVAEGTLPDDLRMSGGPDGKGGFLYRAMMLFDGWVHEVRLVTRAPKGMVRIRGRDKQLARLARIH